MDFEQLSKRLDKLEKGCPKSKTLCTTDAKGSDNECLLADRTYCSTEDNSSPEHQSTSHGSRPVKELTSVRSASISGAATSSQPDLQ